MKLIRKDFWVHNSKTLIRQTSSVRYNMQITPSPSGPIDGSQGIRQILINRFQHTDSHAIVLTVDGCKFNKHLHNTALFLMLPSCIPWRSSNDGFFVRPNSCRFVRLFVHSNFPLRLALYAANVSYFAVICIVFIRNFNLNVLLFD